MTHRSRAVIMRTTLDIEDDVLAAAKELARRQGISAVQMVSRLLRTAPGPTESQAQGCWPVHAGAGFVGTALVPCPSIRPVLI